MAKESKVTRIKAQDTPKGSSSKKAAPTVSTKAAVSSEPKSAKVKKVKTGKKNIFKRIGGYFKGAWQELRVVRWPDRKATWALTLAVIIFSLFFLLIILGLDTLFNSLFQFIIG